MKKQESFRVLCKGRIIYSTCNQDDLFDFIDEISEKYYSEGLFNPEDIVVEFVGTDSE